MKMLNKLKIEIINNKLKDNPKKRYLFLEKIIYLKNRLLRRKVVKNCLIEKYKAIYIPIPRVANTSLKKLFYEINTGKKCLYNEVNKIHRKRLFREASLKKLNSKNYFKFAFVRNPYERLVSCYLATIKKSGKTDEGFYRGVHRGLLENSNKFYYDMDFCEFAKIISKIPDVEANEHFKSQYMFLLREDKLIPDFIGKLETLKKDLIKIYSILKINEMKFPEKLNKSKNKVNYKKYYNDEIKKIVQRRYKKDLDLFKYEF